VLIGDTLDGARWKGSSPEALEWLGRLLKDEGVDLLTADEGQLRRGTPVYVHMDAEVVDVQRLMARYHIRMLPVVEDGRVAGLVDLVELAMRDDLGPDDEVGDAASF
jgi:hypothetical protein